MTKERLLGVDGDGLKWEHRGDDSVRPAHLGLSGMSASIVIGDGLPMELTHFALVDVPPNPDCLVDLDRRFGDVLPPPIIFHQRIHESAVAAWLEGLDRMRDALVPATFGMVIEQDGRRTEVTHGQVTSFDPATGVAVIRFGRSSGRREKRNRRKLHDWARGKPRPSRGWARHVRRSKCRR